MADLFLQTVERALQTLATGTPAEIKEAKRTIERLWHEQYPKTNKRGKQKVTFEKTWGVVCEAMERFDAIASARNQAAFANGLWLFYMVHADEHFDACKAFMLKAIQHDDGRVREAARKLAQYLYISLSSRYHPFVWPARKKNGASDPATLDASQHQAAEQYLAFVREIETLLEQHEAAEDSTDMSEYIEYIEDMKPSVYKSLELLWADMTETPVYADIVSARAPEHIRETRRKIEEDLGKLFDRPARERGVDLIKQEIFLEEAPTDLHELVEAFVQGRPFYEAQTIAGVLSAAWNFFPHQILGGKSPAEMLEEQGYVPSPLL